MLEIIFLFGLGLIWILLATIQDLREREVDNWLNFSLVIFALGFRFFYGFFNSDLGNLKLEDFWFFYQGVFGFGIFYIAGNAFYYSRIFAGGDAKLLIALGAVIPIFNSFLDNLKLMAVFVLLFFIFGALYSLISSLILGRRNFKKLKKEFKKIFLENKLKIIFGIGICLVFVLLGIVESFFIVFGILFFGFFLLLIYAKAVENSCMIKKIKTSELREGDWLYKDVFVKGKKIKANWDGLTSKEISLLKKEKDYVLVKEGIAFVPVFLISFLVLVFLLWNSSWEPEVFFSFLDFFRF